MQMVLKIPIRAVVKAGPRNPRFLVLGTTKGGKRCVFVSIL